jgi:hypothetical protein
MERHEMTKTVTYVDPPSGWKYGFPKAIPDARKKDLVEWLVEEGYPRPEIEAFGAHFYCRLWEESN